MVRDFLNLCKCEFTLKEIGLDKMMEAFEPEKCSFCGEENNIVVNHGDGGRDYLSVQEYVFSNFLNPKDIDGLILYIITDDNDLVVYKYYPSGLKRNTYSGLSGLEELKKVIKYDKELNREIEQSDWKCINKFICVKEFCTEYSVYYVQISE